MNIVVRTYSGKTLVRPDTSRDHNGEDLYVPDFIDSLSFTPVITARMARAGKCVGEKFAHRYFDGIGFGMLMYPDCLLDGSAESFAQASCLDHSSYLPLPASAVDGRNVFSIFCNGREIFRSEPTGSSLLEKALAECTRLCFVRTGDYLAAEMQELSPLCRRADGRIRIEAYSNKEKILDYNIIY